jgi:prepilin-type processing-associated H-X9-DG protein/prepilin-type N-terminal cleavage/methylation domain-containing protein
MKMRPKATRNGFTILELLVVVATVAILVALLLPVLSRAQAKARSTHCQNNLRQIGISVRMYLDTANKWPAMSGVYIGEDELLRANGNEWRKAWFCPLGGSPNSSTLPASEFHYRFNLYGSGDVDIFSPGKPNQQSLGIARNLVSSSDHSGQLGRGEQEILNPSEMIVLTEMGEFSSNAQLSDPFWEGMPFIRQYGYRPYYHHSEKANAWFGDGHVESANKTQLVGRSASARRRWNYDNQPHDENWR